MECTKVPPGIRKAKKKQVKDELDRLKQAEKKKRRLEKALATSAAIRSELEMKKQKKKEEQQRLDEEGAAIAEAVALHVLLGEDSEDSCKIMLKKKDEGFGPWDCASKIDLFMGGRRVVLPREDLSRHSLEGIGWVPYGHGSGYRWNEWENSECSLSPRPFVGDHYMPYSDERVWENPKISAGHIAAQAVASLQIAEDDSYVFNRMFRG